MGCPWLVCVCLLSACVGAHSGLDRSDHAHTDQLVSNDNAASGVDSYILRLSKREVGAEAVKRGNTQCLMGDEVPCCLRADVQCLALRQQSSCVTSSPDLRFNAQTFKLQPVSLHLFFCGVTVDEFKQAMGCSYEQSRCSLRRVSPAEISLNAQSKLLFSASVLDFIYLCVIDPELCLDENALLSFEAICSIHKQMDDDADGSVDTAETDEFLREDLKYHDPKAKHSSFHRADLQISVEDMWNTWKNSKGRGGLAVKPGASSVQGGLQKTSAGRKGLTQAGSEEHHPYSDGAEDFGPESHSETAAQSPGSCAVWTSTRPELVEGLDSGFVHPNGSGRLLVRLRPDQEVQRRPGKVGEGPRGLQKAQEEQRCVQVEKVKVEEKLRNEINSAKLEAQRLQELRQGTENDRSSQKYAEEELEQVRMALKKAERELESRARWVPPEALQKWLQLTHEIEVQYYNIKKQSAERQLLQAREGAEKIKKKRSSLFGTFHVAHSSSLDDVDHKILSAKQALAEVTTALREKLHRWQQIESLTGFCVVNNPGMGALAAALNLDPSFLGLRPTNPQHLLLSDDLDDMDEDILSHGTLQYAAWQMDRRVSDLWPLSGITDSQSPWKHSAQNLTPLRQRMVEPALTFSSQRETMNRSDSDSFLPLAHSEPRSLYGSKPIILSSRVQTLQGQGSGLSKGGGGGGGGLEKSSSLGELRGSPTSNLNSSCSTRSLCITSDITDSPVIFSSSASSSSSSSGRATVLQVQAKRSPVEENGGEESESSGSRRRSAFNKIFKKKQGR
ncbi:Stromal interaction molecule 1 Precursor [Channa argus]|uniref:Stromal interaction molecule 1 n=1 Tax=Channa argus TaxID=215402 RepID=A0A6G1QTE4_CHAAH|nr:Stromal interaction molecule 1 Precursor [Channa argus]